MAIHPGAAMTGDVFNHRRHTTIKKTTADRFAEITDQLRIIAVGAAGSEEFVAIGRWHIDNRIAVNSDAQFGEIMRHLE